MRIIELDQLKGWRAELLEAARQAAVTANCEYSHFPVGAALKIRTPAGEERVVPGNNYELATYRSVCAERNALHRAYADYTVIGEDGPIRPEVTAVAVYCEVGASPQQPCGDCRQALHEVNPDIEVISASGPGRESGAHDPRVTLTSVRTLLPHGFDAASLDGRIAAAASGLRDPEGVEPYVVHLPKPSELKSAAAARAGLLEGVDHLILVGSPRRARRIAALAHERYGARHDADASCYCDLSIPGRDETGREYAVYGIELPGGVKLATASHGVGKAGVEVVLSELPALIALIQGGESPSIRAAIRCGTRATLSAAPNGVIALSTSSRDETLAQIEPSDPWLEKLRAVGRERSMTRVTNGEIDGFSDWPEPSSTLVEGPGISTSFFWHGQGRPLYRQNEFPDDIRDLERSQRAALLDRWVAAGVRWIEMEDYTVLRIAEMVGIPAVTLGAVLAQRRAADGSFQTDYDKRALASELIPPELAIEAILAGD